MEETEIENWDLIIKPQSSLFSLNLIEVWRYRDLLVLMVKRDIQTVYKQTILGPLWFFIQPVFTTLVFTIVFGQIAKLSTDGTPAVLFYLSGLTIWNYFADTLNATSRTFTDNAAIFGKVYFPRLIMPLAKVISGLLKFLIQLILFVAFLIYFAFQGQVVVLNFNLLIIPYLVLLMAVIGLGSGLLLSALTTKYRDLTFLIAFGVQLLMYATPVILPLSSIDPQYKWILDINPLTSIIETFRFVFLGKGMFDVSGLLYSSLFTIILIVVGTVVFNKVEKSFVDTV